MRFEAARDRVAMTLTALTVAGGVAIIGEQSPAPSIVSDAITASCLPEGHIPPEDETTPMDFANLAASIRGAQFFTTAEEYDVTLYREPWEIYNRAWAELRKKYDTTAPDFIYDSTKGERFQAGMNDIYAQLNANTEHASRDFLASKGITVSEARHKVGKGWQLYNPDGYSLDAGPNSSVVSSLSFIPQSIVSASGLSEVVVVSDDTENDLAYPRHEGGTLYLPANYPIQFGLAAMVLDNCPDKAEILNRMTEITEASGARYNLRSRYSYAGFSRWDKKYGDTFTDQDAMISPEEEFVEIFANAIYGWNWYSKDDLRTPLGQKQQLVQGVFNSIFPQGEAWQVFSNIAGAYGTHGLHPHDLANYDLALIAQLSYLDPAAQQQLLENAEGLFTPSSPIGVPNTTDRFIFSGQTEYFPIARGQQAT